LRFILTLHSLSLSFGALPFPSLLHVPLCHYFNHSPVSFTLQVWFGALLNLTFSVCILGVIGFTLQFHSHWYVACCSPPFFFALTIFVVSFTQFLHPVVLVDFVWVHLHLLVLLLLLQDVCFLISKILLYYLYNRF